MCVTRDSADRVQRANVHPGFVCLSVRIRISNGIRFAIRSEKYERLQSDPPDVPCLRKPRLDLDDCMLFRREIYVDVRAYIFEYFGPL